MLPELRGCVRLVGVAQRGTERVRRPGLSAPRQRVVAVHARALVGRLVRGPPVLQGSFEGSLSSLPVVLGGQLGQADPARRARPAAAAPCPRSDSARRRARRHGGRHGEVASRKSLVIVRSVSESVWVQVGGPVGLLLSLYRTGGGSLPTSPSVMVSTLRGAGRPRGGEVLTGVSPDDKVKFIRTEFVYAN